MKIKLTQKYVKELFDYHEDGYLTWKVNRGDVNTKGNVAGCLGTRGYYQVSINNRTYLTHIIIYLWHHGYIPENNIDHEDKNSLNNRINNLREATQSCNVKNSKIPYNHPTGIKGVTWLGIRNRWQSKIYINNCPKNLGYYKDFDDAVFARLAGEQCLNYDSCDNNSTAYQYVQSVINR